jgi:hypothetical protein
MTVPHRPSSIARPSTAPSTFVDMDTPLSNASVSSEPSEADLFSFSATPPLGLAKGGPTAVAAPSGGVNGKDGARLHEGARPETMPASATPDSGVFRPNMSELRRSKSASGPQVGVGTPTGPTPSGSQTGNGTPSGSVASSRRDSGQKSLQEMATLGGGSRPKKAVRPENEQATIDRLTNLSSLKKGGSIL